MMKSVFFAYVGFLMCVFGTSAVAETTIRLTLREAFERASEANLNLLIEQENVESARQDQLRTRSNLMPTVDLGAAQSRNRSNFQNGNLGPQKQYSNRFEALLRGRLSLLNVNNIADYKVAGFNVEIAGLNLEATAQSVLEGIGNAYLVHLRNIGRLQVLQANLARDRVLLDLSRNQFEAGAATSIDVTRSEVQLADTELSLLRQETLVYQSELNIKRILNLPFSSQLELETPALRQHSQREFQQAMLMAAASDRPDLVQALRVLERNRYARKAVGWERLPSLDLSADWGYGGETPSDDLEEQWRLQLGFSMPLFDGFRIRSNKLQADALIRRQEYLMENLMQDLEADLRFDLRDIQSRWQQIEVARKRLLLSEREYELARTRFQEGVADNRDVVDAQARLAGAQDGLIDAEYQYQAALLSLARSRGDIWSVLNEY